MLDKKKKTEDWQLTGRVIASGMLVLESRRLVVQHGYRSQVVVRGHECQAPPLQPSDIIIKEPEGFQDLILGRWRHLEIPVLLFHRETRSGWWFKAQTKISGGSANQQLSSYIIIITSYTAITMWCKPYYTIIIIYYHIIITSYLAQKIHHIWACASNSQLGTPFIILRPTGSTHHGDHALELGAPRMA